VAKVGTSNQDHTISLKASVRSCTNKTTIYRSLNAVVVQSKNCQFGVNATVGLRNDSKYIRQCISVSGKRLSRKGEDTLI
jgi:hypothetical protein